MAVTAHFIADFESFYSAVEKSEVKLRSFEADSAKVEKQLNRMADSFSGRRVIQEATLMAEAIKETGGISRLTGSELQRAGALAEEAAEKLRSLGQTVPPGIQRIAEASKEARPALGGLREATNQFDGVLGALGINLNKQVKAIEDFAGVSGKTASQLGLLGSAGLVAGTALASWEFGRMIAEATGADEAIANLTASVMGYGDVVAETAGAKQDTINLAIANGAKETITYAEAIEYNSRVVKDQIDTLVGWDERLSIARESVQQLSEEEIRQIQVARQLGATQEELKRDFGLTADAVKALDELLEKKGNNEKKLADLEKQLSDQRVKNIERESRAAEENYRKFSNLAQENLALELSMIGTKGQAKAAAIEAEFQREVAKLNRLDSEYAKFYGLLEQQRDLKLASESAHFERINAVSRTAMEERAAQEQATLEAMLARSGEFSAAQIAQQRDTWYAALEAVRNFGLEGGAVFEGLASKAEQEAARAAAAWAASNPFTESTQATLDRARGIDPNETPADRKKREAREKAEREKPISMTIQPLTESELEAIRQSNILPTIHDDRALWAKLKQLEEREGTYAPKDNVAYNNMIAEQAMLAQLRMWAQGRSRPPGFKDGVENFSGGLAYVHKEELLVNLPKGTSVIPAGRSGARGDSYTFNLSLSGMVGDKRAVGDYLIKVLEGHYKSLGYKQPTQGFGR